MGSALRTVVEQALAGNETAAREIVRLLHPVVQARVVRVLRRTKGQATLAWRAQVDDLVQETFAGLFRDGGKVLRDWNPERGLSLQNYVGLFAERRAISSLRRRGPIDLTGDVTLDELAEISETPAGVVESAVATRELLQVLLDRLREELSPLGMRLFELVYINECTVEEVVATTGMTAEAVYAWRSRLRHLVSKLASDLTAAHPHAPRTHPGSVGHET